jgi:hypothetical protein
MKPYFKDVQADKFMHSFWTSNNITHNNITLTTNINNNIKK